MDWLIVPSYLHLSHMNCLASGLFLRPTQGRGRDRSNGRRRNDLYAGLVQPEAVAVDYEVGSAQRAGDAPEAPRHGKHSAASAARHLVPSTPAVVERQRAARARLRLRHELWREGLRHGAAGAGELRHPLLYLQRLAAAGAPHLQDLRRRHRE